MASRHPGQGARIPDSRPPWARAARETWAVERWFSASAMGRILSRAIRPAPEWRRRLSGGGPTGQMNWPGAAGALVADQSTATGRVAIRRSPRHPPAAAHSPTAGDRRPDHRLFPGDLPPGPSTPPTHRGQEPANGGHHPRQDPWDDDSTCGTRHICGVWHCEPRRAAGTSGPVGRQARSTGARHEWGDVGGHTRDKGIRQRGRGRDPPDGGCGGHSGGQRCALLSHPADWARRGSGRGQLRGPAGCGGKASRAPDFSGSSWGSGVREGGSGGLQVGEGIRSVRDPGRSYGPKCPVLEIGSPRDSERRPACGGGGCGGGDRFAEVVGWVGV